MINNIENLKKIGFDTLKIFNSNCWIAGGAISDFFLGRERADLDIFFPNQVSQKAAIEKFISMGAKLIREYPLGSKLEFEGEIYDLVHLGNSPEQTISRFDYSVCCAAIDKDGNFYCHENYFEHIGNKEIHYIGNHPNINFKNKSKRLQGYINKGFCIKSKQLVKWLDRLIKDQNRLRNKKKIHITEFKITKTKIN
tara:strand:+ start:395 stop:982 length:588 start_codon:yes stop_codon:yes gene_type:complete